MRSLRQTTLLGSRLSRRNALLVLATCHPAWAAAAPAGVLPLRLSHDRVFLPVRVLGQAMEALLDSAAEMTLVDTTWAREIGLVAGKTVTAQGSGGNQAAAFAKGVRLEAAGLRLGPMTVAVTDLQQLSERLLGEPVRVILGREWFDAARWHIDLQAQTVQRLPRTDTPAGQLLRLRSERGIEAIRVEVEGHPAWADLDLGNGSDVLLGRSFAERHGLLQPGRVVDRVRGGGLGGVVERDVVVLRELVVAGRRFENLRAAIDSQPSAGELNLGTRVLRHFDMTWDFGRHRAWMRSLVNPDALG